jgi:hypothetical protein
MFMLMHVNEDVKEQAFVAQQHSHMLAKNPFLLYHLIDVQQDLLLDTCKYYSLVDDYSVVLTPG